MRKNNVVDAELQNAKIIYEIGNNDETRIS